MRFTLGKGIPKLIAARADPTVETNGSQALKICRATREHGVRDPKPRNVIQNCALWILERESVQKAHQIAKPEKVPVFSGPASTSAAGAGFRRFSHFTLLYCTVARARVKAPEIAKKNQYACEHRLPVVPKAEPNQLVPARRRFFAENLEIRELNSPVAAPKPSLGEFIFGKPSARDPRRPPTREELRRR